MIEPSTSPWSAQVVLTSEKDSSYRYYVDFRRLYSVTLKEPRVEDMTDVRAGAKFFSNLELISAYDAFETHPDETLAVEASSLWTL